ncbi:hypothetical protein PTTG_12527 [Puccinia triticina 1-1 BBBD Race 1]|uniref:Uncharacterized protein n=1 Tax=Puccinia triticina (isolate 1-1 / race 1 (BBBD)) TaxID=630390 RepID=A0A180G932_PUCT1|nr:hypothetical protein PTTG_12527 [Puccinia triticina 1-1 BBBD Race 1]
MVSLAYLITLLSVLVAASRAEEVSGAKNEDVDAKWLGGFSGMFNSFYSLGGMGLGMFGSPWINSLAWSMGGACFGGAVFPMNMALGMGGFFAKASEQEALSVSRRAIHLDAEHLLRRHSADSVTCTSNKGVSEVFSKSQCLKAAQTLREKSLHSASSGSCQLSLHSSKEKVVAKEIPDHILQKAVNSILSTCNEKNTHPKDAKAPHIDDKQVVMFLSRH